MNWLDVVVLLIIGGEVFRAFRQGMVKTLIELGAWIVALIAAKLYYKALAAYMVTRFKIFSNLEETIYNSLTKNFSTQDQLQQAVSSGQLGGPLDMPNIISKLPKDMVSKAGDSMNQAVYGDLSHRISEWIINGSSFMIIVFGIIMALSVLTLFLDQIMKLPLLKEANKLGGIAVGVIRGAFSVLVLMTIITFLLPFLHGTWLLDAIKNSQVAIYFYNNNLLLYLIYYLLR